MKKTVIHKVLTKMKILVKAACLEEVVVINHATDVATEAVMVAATAVTLKRLAANWKILPSKFAISKIAKCHKILALPLSRADLSKTERSLIFFKLMWIRSS